MSKLIRRRRGFEAGILWSGARIASVTIGALVERRGQNDGVHKQIEDTLRYADVTIIEGQPNSSQLGSGIVAARVANLMFRDDPEPQ